MKRKAWVAALLAALAVSESGYAVGAVPNAGKSETAEFHWYCKNNDNHQPPELPAEFSFVEENGGFYLDKKVPAGEKVIYLTFDAGYENGNVGKILDILKEHKATGAFFVLGNLIQRNPELVKRMVEEGHLVCNHTNRHRNMAKVTDPEAFRQELESLNQLMLQVCGTPLAPFYRPPEGSFSERNLKCAADCGYRTVFWSYAYADWDNGKQMSPEKAKEKVLAHTHNGEVLLLHPTSATNAAILDGLLDAWEAEGYRFGTLYELTRMRTP